MLNIRGNDVAHCPVTMAYALVTLDGASLFIDRAKMSRQVEAEMKLSEDNPQRAEVHPPTVSRSLRSLPRTMMGPDFIKGSAQQSYRFDRRVTPRR